MDDVFVWHVDFVDADRFIPIHRLGELFCQLNRVDSGTKGTAENTFKQVFEPFFDLLKYCHRPPPVRYWSVCYFFVPVRRGVRGLFLMTLSRPELEVTLGKLERQGIHHFVQELNQFKVNLFFGRPAYVAVARSIVTRPLNALTAEEDFMLGTLLGYDREQQCRRFLTRSGRGMPEDLPLAAE